MDRVFLDANVLFSAAWKERSGLSRLWELADVQLFTSTYALEEARRNLDTAPQHSRLIRLVEGLTQVTDEALWTSEYTAAAGNPSAAVVASSLPEKDQPILLAAIAVQATHLITGDAKHFGRFFGQSVGGVLILPPRQYLDRRSDESGSSGA